VELTRPKAFGGLAIGVLVVIASTAAIIFTGDSPFRQKLNDAVSSGLLIGVLGLLAGLVVEVIFRVTTPQALVEIIQGEDHLKDRYQSMRETRGTTRVQAIWSTRYGDVKDYFQREELDLKANEELEIERLVNPDVVEDRFQAEFDALRRRNPRLTVWATDIKEFECFICEYVKGGSRFMKALLVVNDHTRRQPQLGVYIDPARNEQLSAIALAIQSWFVSLPRTPYAGAAEGSVWEANAGYYDRLVTSSPYPFLRDFMEREHALLESVATRLIGEGATVSIVEVGCGTGRTLFDYARNERLLAKTKYIIGVDTSRAMLNFSRNKRDILFQQHALPDDFRGRLIFLPLDGAELSKCFEGGTTSREKVRQLQNGEPVGVLDSKELARSSVIFCTLLNTIGVMRQETRNKVLLNMVRAAGRGDRIVVSVFAAASFRLEAAKLYEQIRDLVGEFQRSDFHIDTCEFDSQSYYSHWFNADEITSVLAAAGCKNIDMQGIGSTGYFIVAEPPDTGAG